ncbi:MAG TPA: hypothetical protein VHX11_01435 [Acidobacteriaceae bacterium]|nr:hypothetical protein [Acidobacteriaceae bacterium]
MNTEEILRQIDAEISRLERARELFLGQRRNAGSGRTRGIAAAHRAGTAHPGAVRKKRTISAEGRARIAAAQKRRWAKQKQAKAES